MSQPEGGGGKFGGGGASGGWDDGGGGNQGAGAGNHGAGGNPNAGGNRQGGAGGPGGGGGGDGGGGGAGAGGGGGMRNAGGKPGRGRARVAAEPAPVEIPDTGNAKVDAMGDVFNNALAPFQNAPPAEQGAIGVVNHAIGAVMGLSGMGMELMNTGFAMATAGIAAAMPAFPAAFLTVPHIGMPHAHAHPPSLIPPAPPVPLPSIGTLMLAGSVGVLVCGMPAGRCGDLGLAVTCGSFSPAFDVFLGSSNTFIAGNRAARMMDMTRHCNPASAALAVSRGAALFSAAVGAVGVAAEAAGGGAVVGSIAQIAADLAAAAMSALLGKDPGIPPAMGALMMGAPTVLIGGFPCPNLPDPLSAMMKGLKCLSKKFLKSKGFGKLLNKVGLCNQPGEPINSFNGEVYNDIDDFSAGDSGFVWQRHYRSGWNNQDGPLGFGYRHFYQRNLTLLRKRALYETHDGELMALARREDGGFEPRDGFRLVGDGQKFLLKTDRDEELEFELVPLTAPASARLTRYRTQRAHLYLYYDASDRLRAITEVSFGRTVDVHFVYDAKERIEQVYRGMRGQSPMLVCRYAYREGCLVEHVDAVGAPTRYTYDASRRMTRAQGPSGYGFSWAYDRMGRCIESAGDDGLWGVKARYEGSQSTFTEPDGGEWTFKHYPDGTISHILDPYGGVTEYQRDASGRIVLQKTPGGREYVWLYDADGKHVGRLDSLGNQLPPEDDDPDADGRDHDGPVTQRQFLVGRPLWRMHPLLRQLPPQIGAAVHAARQTAVVLKDAPSAPTVDAAGRYVARPEADGNVTTFVYDPDGNVAAEHFGPPGSAEAELRAGLRGAWATRQFGSWQLLMADVSPLGCTTRYEYNHREHLRSVTDGNGNRTEYTRDRRQRVREIHRYGEVYRRYSYNATDAIVEEQDGAGNTLVKHETDENGQHLSSTLASGEIYKYAYDANGRFTVASSSKHEVKLRRNGEQRELDQRDGKGVVHRYTPGQRLRRTEYFKRFKVKYFLGRDARLRIATPDGSLHSFWRDTEQTVRENGNGTAEALTFDAGDRLAARVCWRTGRLGQGATWSTSYRYDSVGRLLYSTDGPQITSYEYDADRRLIKQHDGRGERRYAYDLGGNLTRTPRYGTLDYVEGNLLRHAEMDHFYYDNRRRLVQRDRQGGGSTEYRYDSLGQLVEVRWNDRPDIWRAAYDGLGRRLWREYGGKRTDFYWDGDRLAAERFPEGNLRLYVYPNADALVPFMWLDYAGEDADPATGRAFYLFTAPTGLPLRVEDAQGREIWRATAADAYGEIDESSGRCPTRLRFAGHFHDEALELFYNRFRDYDPALGRYLQPDPLGLEGGINLFAYPVNPLVDVDLRGLTVHRKPRKKSAKKKQNSDKPTSEGDRPEALKKAEKEAKRRKLVRKESEAGPPHPPGTRKVEYGDPPTATYHVDSQGRTIRAEGELDPPAGDYDKKGVSHIKPDGFVEGQDHRGHLVTESLAKDQKHANVRENVIAEHGTKSNTSEKAKFENSARDHAAENPGCRMISEPIYDGDNPRPTAVTHTLVDADGKPVQDPGMHPNPRTIPNPDDSES